MSLVITRQPNESVTVYTADGAVTFYINKVNGKRVRVAISAPPQCDISRGELIAKPPASVDGDDDATTAVDSDSTEHVRISSNDRKFLARLIDFLANQPQVPEGCNTKISFHTTCGVKS